MRLLNATTREFAEFYGEQTPKYAILSDTWEQSQEITYQEWLSPTAATSMKSGYRKIIATCVQALNDDYQWIWVDTNCIDKSCSAELSEAVNSMYAWYRDAELCYVYLADIVAPGAEIGPNQHRQVRDSRWHTRGWTLQELLAPRSLEFFALDWSPLGNRSELAREIEMATGIRKVKRAGSASVARKMSWLSRRQTSRTEDMAYCMLGLFNITMPLLYGEGDRAFLRPQEEIIRKTADLIIFCWELSETAPLESEFHSLLAPNPAAFVNSGGYFLRDTRCNIHLEDWPITNRGLSLSLPTLRYYKCTFVVLDDVGHISDSYQTFLLRVSILSQFHGSTPRMEFPPGPLVIPTNNLEYIAPNIERYKEPVILPLSGERFERQEVRYYGFTSRTLDGSTAEDIGALFTEIDRRPTRASSRSAQDFRVLLLGGHDFVGSGRDEKVSYPDDYTPSNRSFVLGTPFRAHYQHNPHEALARLVEVYINGR